jgi:hypothetical protein
MQAQIELTEEAYAEAQQSLQEAINILRQVNHPVVLGVSLAILGGVACRTHNLQPARHYLLEPLRVALETRAVFLLHVTLAFVALLLAEQDQPEHAVEIYTLAARFPYVANSRWYEDIIGRHVAEVEATLPPEAVTAAQARGRTREAWATAAELLAELEKPTVHLG